MDFESKESIKTVDCLVFCEPDFRNHHPQPFVQISSCMRFFGFADSFVVKSVIFWTQNQALDFPKVTQTKISYQLLSYRPHQRS